MGLEFLRSNGARCPPLLVCGLMAMCVFLLCNWRSLSSQNFELLKQIDNFAEQMKINGEELEKCSGLKVILNEKLKDSQNKFVEQQIKIEQAKASEEEAKESYDKINAALKEAEKRSESIENNFNICHTEMDSLKKLSEAKEKVLETFRTEKDSLKLEIEQKNEIIKKLEEKLKSNQKTNSDNKINIHNDSMVNDSLPNINKLKQPIIKTLGFKGFKKIQRKNVNENKTERVPKGQQNSHLIQDEKDLEEQKNYGDASLMPLDSDPREQEMKTL